MLSKYYSGQCPELSRTITLENNNITLYLKCFQNMCTFNTLLFSQFNHFSITAFSQLVHAELFLEIFVSKQLFFCLDIYSLSV